MVKTLCLALIVALVALVTGADGAGTAFAAPAVAAAAPTPKREIELTFISGDAVLGGTLYQPAGAGPFPTVVVAHGASGGLRTFPLYQHLQMAMRNIGVAVFVYDRRGSGQSTGTLAEADYGVLADDLVQAIDMLAARPDVDASRIGVWGHSQGGWIAPMAYARAPGRIAWMVLVSGSGVTPSAQMEYAAQTQVLAAGYGPAAARLAADIRRLRDGWFRGTTDRATAQAAIDSAVHEPWFPLLFIAPTLPADPSRQKWRREMDVSVTEGLCDVRIPMALFYGDKDSWVPVSSSIAVWRGCLAGHDEGLEVHRIPGAGHTMIVDEAANPDLDAPDLHFSERYEAELVDFVRRQTGVGALSPG